jgi:transposase
MGTLDRLVLSDGQRERILGHVIGDERTRGSSGRDNRMFVEAVLWIVRTGSPWRDLPDVGWEFVHVSIDDASRIAVTAIYLDERAVSAIAALKAAVAC